MPLTGYMEKSLLDWALGGAAASSPAGRYLQFATSAPDANNEYNGLFGARKTVTFNPASTPSGMGSAANANALIGTASAAGYTVQGWNLYDALTAGNRIMYGTTSAPLSVGSGDAARLTAGSLVISLS